MMVRPERRACVVAIGGFDPTGGAGVVRDFITGQSLAGEIRMVPTALTEQSSPSTGVFAIEARAPADLQSAVTKALASFGSASAAEVVVKVGMLPGGEAVDAVMRGLARFAGAIVVDPVLATSRGVRLFRAPASRLMPLLARATVVTPNAPELHELTGEGIAAVDDAVRAGTRLLDSGITAVLIKGGHIAGGADATDILLTRSADGATAQKFFRLPRLAGPPVRGTGCALGTAIATGLSRGSSLEEAVLLAKEWLHRAIASAVPAGDEYHLGR